MTIQYFDSHAHLCNDEIYPTIDSIIGRARTNQVTNILNICTDLDTLAKGLALQKKYPGIYTAAATTPHDIELEGEIAFPTIARHARNGDLTAIGETGLDYHRHGATAETQKYFLRRYLQLALECKLPVVIHCRDAYADFFKILDEEYIVEGKHAPGVLHCFTGTLEEAKEVIRRGWFLSLSGIITFKKSLELREIAKWVPLDQLLVETDSPYLAPQSKRGSINEPSFVPETVTAVASAKGISVEEVAKVTSENCFRLIQKTSQT
ncbi:MAG: TatD family hydrolase [Parachlamydiaceae bacterium]|nr:TatD family hydrolase [Parachlamydiaceae bacterium]